VQSALDVQGQDLRNQIKVRDAWCAIYLQSLCTICLTPIHAFSQIKSFELERLGVTFEGKVTALAFYSGYYPV